MSQKILIVDDDPGVIHLCDELLKTAGYETSSAFDGLDALSRIKKEDPDLVILDIMMPEINGYDVCCELRFNEEFKKIPIVILTSSEMELSEEIQKRSNLVHLSKPIETKLLLETVEKMLS